MMKIIIVDDEVIIVRGLSKLIDRMGAPFQVIGIFTQGEDALKYIQENSVDVLITDIRMPKMDGLSLVSQAKAVCSQLHCIFLTGYSDFEYARCAVKLGAVDYLLKPIDEQELQNALYRVLSQNVDILSKEVHANYTREVEYLKSEMEINYAKFDLGTCAEKLGKTRDYLCKLYKKETGISLPEYLKQVRMEQAKQLLEHIDGYKVYEISELVGFVDSVYFAKQFKKYTGMSPKDYQRYGASKARDKTTD